MRSICFFCGDITRDGGTERAASMIANTLIGEGKYRIIFLSLTEQHSVPFFALDSRISRHALGDKWISPGPGYLRLIPRLRRFLKEQHIDVLIDVDIVLDALSIPALRGSGTKIISWEHFNLQYEMASWYRRSILKYSVRHSDYIVTLTNRDREAYENVLGRYDRIATIHNPMNVSASDLPSEREKWIVTVGHLITIKGMDLLAQTALRVLKEAPGWQWLVIGEGEERNYLEEFIRKHHLENQLILTGRTRDVNSYLHRAQIYVMTSRLEGLGMCLLEAKEFSLPIVSFDVPTGPSEIVKDSQNGYLVPPFDCDQMSERILQLIRDEQLRARFMDHAQDNMKEFQIEPIAEAWNQVLDTLLMAAGEKVR